MFFNVHGKSSKYLKYEVKSNLVQGFRLYVTFFGDGKRACRFLNNANLQIRRFVKKPTICNMVMVYNLIIYSLISISDILLTKLTNYTEMVYISLCTCFQIQ